MRCWWPDLLVLSERKADSCKTKKGMRFPHSCGRSNSCDLQLPTGKLLFGGHSSKLLQWVQSAHKRNASLPMKHCQSTPITEDITWPRGDTKFLFSCWKIFHSFARYALYTNQSNTKHFQLNSSFVVKGAICCVVIAMVIFSRVKMTYYFHM